MQGQRQPRSKAPKVGGVVSKTLSRRCAGFLRFVFVSAVNCDGPMSHHNRVPVWCVIILILLRRAPRSHTPARAAESGL